MLTAGVAENGKKRFCIFHCLDRIPQGIDGGVTSQVLLFDNPAIADIAGTAVVIFDTLKHIFDFGNIHRNFGGLLIYKGDNAGYAAAQEVWLQGKEYERSARQVADASSKINICAQIGVEAPITGCGQPIKWRN